MNISSVLNFNDKCLLYLLELSRKNRKEYNRLRSLYGNDFHHKHIVGQYLAQEGYIQYKGVLLCGEWTEDKDCPVEITILGERALSEGVFSSETAKKISDKRERMLRNISLIVSIIGGLLGFFSFIYNFLIDGR